MVAYRAAFREVQGATVGMNALRAAGVRVGVLTNYVRDVQEESLQMLALHGHVDVLVTVSDAPRSASQARTRRSLTPWVFTRAMRSWWATPGRTTCSAP